MFKALCDHHKIAIIYILILILDRIDLTILNVAIPFLVNFFQIEPENAEWFNLSFLIGLSLSMTLSSWLGENFGYKKIFLCGVFGFAFFSLACAEAGNFLAFIFFRFLQGFSGGAMIPTGNTILFRSCEKKDYAKITNFVFFPTLLAPALAPLIGGFILTKLSYKWIFYINLPICFFVLFFGFLIIQDSHALNKKKFDFLGFILGSISILSLLIGSSILLQEKFLFSILLFITSGIFLYFFIKFEKTQENPIIDFSYFNKKLFKAASLIQLFFQMAHFGSFFIIGLFLQFGIGFDPFKTGLILSAQAFGALCVTLYSKSLYYKFGARLPISLGMLGVFLITPLILFVQTKENLILWFIIMFSRGLFSGLVGTPLHTISMIESGKNDFDLGRMSSIFGILRQISIALGISFGGFAISLTNFFAKINYHSFDLSYFQSIQIFGFGIFMISIFSLIGSLISFFSLNQK